MGGRRTVVYYSVVEGEGVEEREEEDGEPDGERDEDCVHEAGSGDGGGEGAVWALGFVCGLSSFAVQWEKGHTKPSGRLLQI